MSGQPPLHSYAALQFDVIYAGLIPDICVDSIDPSGRTDLLRIIDKAKLSGDVCPSSPVGDPRCQLILEQYSIRLLNSRTQELLLFCPVEQLVSVGYVSEMNHHILPLVIGHSANEGTSHDLALLYAPDKGSAEGVCGALSSRFQHVYRETVSAAARSGGGGGAGRATAPAAHSTSARTASSQSPCIDARPMFLSDSASDLRARASTTTRSPSDTDGVDVASEYIHLVTSLLSQNELREFATLLQRWQDGALPVRELALKLMELYGPERRHLLARLRLLLRGDDLETLHEFLDIHGITECAGSDSSAGFRSDARSGGTE